METICLVHRLVSLVGTWGYSKRFHPELNRAPPDLLPAVKSLNQAHSPGTLQSPAVSPVSELYRKVSGLAWA